MLAPRGERGQKTAVGVRRVGRDVAAYFLKVQAVDAVAGLLDLGEPAFEAQEAHASAFEALRFEALRAAGDVAVAALQRPAGGGAQIEGEDGGGHSVSPCFGLA
ncbi:hypothetical protein D9M68_927670 [compost metagenome]